MQVVCCTICHPPALSLDLNHDSELNVASAAELTSTIARLEERVTNYIRFFEL